MATTKIYIAVKGSEGDPEFSFFRDEERSQEISALQLSTSLGYEFVAAGDNWGAILFNISDNGTNAWSHTDDITIEPGDPGAYSRLGI